MVSPVAGGGRCANGIASVAIRSCVASWAVTEELPVAEARVEAVVYILKLIESMLIMFLYCRFKLAGDNDLGVTIEIGPRWLA